MTGSPGLRRFVSGPPDVAPAGAALPAHSPPETQTADPVVTVGAPQPSRAVPPAADIEKCGLCSTEVPAEHGHIADLEQSSLMCACRACYLLFTHSQAGRGRYRSVPDRCLSDPEHPLTASEWDTLEVPVGLAFFLHSSQQGNVTGFYPSPAGATECRLDLQAWDRLAADHPLLGAVAPDVEAALISRSDAGVECFLVPIDACYELAGRMRLHWRGFDGGAEARASIAEFLDTVRARARALSTEA